MRMVVTPVRVSPLRMAHWMGPAPRYFGSSDACTLMMPSGARSMTVCGMIWP